MLKGCHSDEITEPLPQGPVYLEGHMGTIPMSVLHRLKTTVASSHFIPIGDKLWVSLETKSLESASQPRVGDSILRTTELEDEP
jgi:hypothetical protein